MANKSFEQRATAFKAIAQQHASMLKAIALGMARALDHSVTADEALKVKISLHEAGFKIVPRKPDAKQS